METTEKTCVRVDTSDLSKALRAIRVAVPSRVDGIYRYVEVTSRGKGFTLRASDGSSIWATYSVRGPSDGVDCKVLADLKMFSEVVKMFRSEKVNLIFSDHLCLETDGDKNDLPTSEIKDFVC